MWQKDFPKQKRNLTMNFVIYKVHGNLLFSHPKFRKHCSVYPFLFIGPHPIWGLPSFVFFRFCTISILLLLTTRFAFNETKNHLFGQSNLFFSLAFIKWSIILFGLDDGDFSVFVSAAAVVIIHQCMCLVVHCEFMVIVIHLLI